MNGLWVSQADAEHIASVVYTSFIWDGYLAGTGKMQPWEWVTVTSVALGGLMVTGRYGLRAWSLYQLRTLARESHALERWWSVIAELPAELQTQPFRCTLGRIMYQRLKRARRIQPDHPYLHSQLLQIARFIGRSPRDAGCRLTGTTRQQAVAALTELHRLLTESAADRLISRAELSRCELGMAEALVRLEFEHYRQAALQAEFLNRTPQAIEYLRSAVRAAQRFGEDSDELHEVAARLQRLESGEMVAMAAS